MDCKLIEEPLGNGKSRYSCPNCPQVFVFKSGFGHAKRACKAEAPPPGPGTHLTLLMKEIDAVPTTGCKCFERAREMDQRGVEWCRENKETIRGWLGEALKEVKWLWLVSAGMQLIKRNWFNPLAPIESMVDEALRRAEASPE